MKRTGIFGGSFDPVHAGHVSIARAAADAAALDEVLFVPAAVSPFKTSSAPRASGHDRLVMAALACEEDPRFRACAAELERGGVSRAIDTVRAIRAARPSDSLYFILGADAAAGLGMWFEAAELFKLVTFLVFERPGAVVPPPPTGAQTEIFRGDPVDVSSTEIRRRAAAGESLAGLVPRKVAEYISAHSLYAPQAPRCGLRTVRREGSAEKGSSGQ